MPPLLASKIPELHWLFVLPVEFANPAVTTVGVYALFVYAHLKYQEELAKALEISHAENGAMTESQATAEQTGNAIAKYLEAVRAAVK